MKTKLTIHLFKEHIREDKEILKNIDDGDLKQKTIGHGIFYYKFPQGKSPKWVDTFFKNDLNIQFPDSKSVQAVYIVRQTCDNKERIFALTFGYGRNLLNLDNIENRFGLLVTLNSINQDNVRFVDTAETAASGKAQRTQMSRLSNFSEFGFSIEKDYLRTIMGRTKDGFAELLGNNVTGKDSLVINIDNDYTNIHDVLEKVFDLYKSKEYQHDFEWIDYLKEIKDKSTIEKLNSELLKLLQDGQVDDISIMVPEILNWDDFEKITYNDDKKNYYDFCLTDALTELGNNLTLNKLRKSHLNIFYSNGSRKSWPIYKCINGEIYLNDKLYVINSGIWNEFSTNYVDSINKDYDNIPVGDIDFSQYIPDEGEGTYNEREVHRMPNDRVLFDRKLIRPQGETSSIEVCDILENKNSFIHVKIYSGSATLSHLFNQGYVSGLLLLQKTFRDQLNSENVAKNANVAFPSDDFNPHNYKIVFAIVKKGTENRPQIPFFSKISLRHVYKTLTSFGYDVKIQRIDM